MRRSYISPIETVVDPHGWTVRQPRVTTLLGKFPQSVVYPAGGSAATWCLVLIDAPDHTAALADATIDAFPDVSGLDVNLGAIAPSLRNRFLTALANRGVDTSALTTSSSFREAVRMAGRTIEPTYDENNAI